VGGQGQFYKLEDLVAIIFKQHGMAGWFLGRTGSLLQFDRAVITADESGPPDLDSTAKITMRNGILSWPSDLDPMARIKRTEAVRSVLI
jgi:hypothetical protein